MASSFGSRVAADKAGAASFADRTPLLSNKDGCTVATSVNSYEHEHRTIEIDAAKPTAARIFKSFLVSCLAVAGATASIILFTSLAISILELQMTIVVCVSGGMCLLNSPLVAYMEWKILFSPSRRETVEHLQRMAVALKEEAVLIQNEIEHLTRCASRFDDAERDLDEVARSEGYSVQGVMELVHDYEDTMDAMKDNLRQKVIEDVIGIVMNCGKRSSDHIDGIEAKLLALKIFVKLEAYGVTFDEDKFSKAVALNPSLYGVIGTVRKLLPPDEEHTDDVSIVSDQGDMFDMFYMSTEEQQREPSLASAVEDRSRSLATRRQHASESNHALPGRRFPSR